MTASQPPPRSRRSRVTIFLTAVITGLVLLGAALLAPKYRRHVVTVDDAQRWSESSAPPRREIVWQPAVPVIPEASEPQDSYIRPQLSDGGSVLYFTICGKDNSFDIARSRRVDGGWSAPQRVPELNSDSVDVGPVIRDDGQVLYLYSGREGGFGGTDLYVSQRSGEGWGRPVNLGPNINSAADEYDPAISPDGQRLFFSSNRTPLTASANSNHWSTTLRRDTSNRRFDLYAADLDAADRWEQAAPLQWLNEPDHNEGAPFVSPDGEFLWFASDRPTARGESTNFDIYRARIDRRDLPPENLGSVVNTPADEIEPALSAAGFRLHFSRSDVNGSSHYALYESTAQEVYHQRRWDDSNLQSFVAALARVAKFLFDRLWLILLILATLAALAYLIRQIRVRHVAVPGFLIAALLLHLCLATGSFFVFFQDAITHKLREMFEYEPVVATQVLLSSTVPETAQQTAFDRVARLDMPAPIKPADLVKQSTEIPSQTQPIELLEPQQIAGNIPLSADLLDDPVIATVKIQDKPTESIDRLDRRSVQWERPTEQIRFERTASVEVPQIEAVELDPIRTARQALPPSSDRIQPIAMETDKQPPMPATASEKELQPTLPVLPESTPIAVELSREPHRALDSTSIDTPVPTEQIASVEIKETPAPETQSVQLDRMDRMLAPALEQPEPIKLAQPNANAAKPLRRESLTPLVTINELAGSPRNDSAASPLKRASVAKRAADFDSLVATEAMKAIATDSKPASTSPQPKVDIDRQETKRDSIHIDALAMAVQRTPIPLASAAEINPVPLVASTRGGADRQDLPEGGLVRRRSSKQNFADLRVNLTSLLLRRQLDEVTKAEVVKEFGGNDQTLAAIRRGLTWIEAHQVQDGHWGLHDFHKTCQGHKQCSGRGQSKSDTAGTGLALLPFLGDGNTHKEGPHKDAVARGITWLVKNQKPDGNLFTGGEGNAFMYSHAIAAIALCECYGMTGDQSLRHPAQLATDFIVSAQDPKSGGWRYRPRQFADTSVVGWQVMALKSAQMAELNVPEKTFDAAQRWLDSVAGNKQRLGQFAYQGNRYNPAMTAEALLCLEYLDADRGSEPLLHGADFLLKNLPKKGRESSYYWYYGTQAMFHLQGDHWQRWNDAIHPLLIATQSQKGPTAGTWDPRDQWEKRGGRIYSTSLRVLMLEVYYRHLPIYQVIE